MNESNVNSEMSDLVHLAEEWALQKETKVGNRDGVNFIFREVLEKAALLLINQLGIKTVTEFEHHFGKLLKEDRSDECTNVARECWIDPLVLSPMPKEEFQSIIKNGWPRTSNSPVAKLTKEEIQSILNNGCSAPLPDDLLGSKRRKSMLASVCPLSPIISELSGTSPRKTTIRPLDQSLNRRGGFNTSTPISNRNVKKNQLDFLTPTGSLKDLRSRSVGNEKRELPRRNSMTQLSPIPISGEGPLENRASRLRKLKIEEKMRKTSGMDRLSNTNRTSIESMNNALSDFSSALN